MKKLINRLLSKNISLRSLHHCLLIATALVTGILIFVTIRSTNNAREMISFTEEHINLEKDALQLMEASDYLTENVQRFTIEGKREFMDKYFYEANESKRREDAIAKMSLDHDAHKALESLEEALDASIKLMQREYYAMKLVVEAKQITDYPQELDTVTLTKEEMELSSEEKMKLATSVVLDEEYYSQKEKIRSKMQNALDLIDEHTKEIDKKEVELIEKELRFTRIVILLYVLAVILMVWASSYLGIQPVLNAADSIKKDNPIEETGSNEFRYLAKAYNKMYDLYKQSIEHLNYKASHDELTGAYNRAGYDLLISSLDLSKTCEVMIDIDNFKEINDTFGHEVGDKVLKNLVKTIKSVFRSEDYVCRIGGDEFIIFMTHINENELQSIDEKIKKINELIKTSKDGLPVITISAGIIHGKQAANADDMYEKVDTALYESKRNGKNQATYYKK